MRVSTIRGWSQSDCITVMTSLISAIPTCRVMHELHMRDMDGIMLCDIKHDGALLVIF